MIKLDIKNISDGKTEFELNHPSKDVMEFFPEFIGDISIKGTLIRYGTRYSLDVNCSCNTKLICDYSLEEFEEVIETNLKMNFLADSLLYELIDNKGELNENNEMVIPEDSTELDITKEVVEVLAVALPMKRISPKYEGKDLSEIFPDITNIAKEDDTDNKEDERWSELKKIKFKN